MARYVLTHNQRRNFAEQQIQDIQHELERIRRLINIEALVCSLEQQRPVRDLKQNEKDSIATMQQLTKKSGRFTDKDGQMFDGYMKQLEHLNNLPGLGINERERKAIVSALSMGQGHWYVCPRGHPYVITEVRPEMPIVSVSMLIYCLFHFSVVVLIKRVYVQNVVKKLVVRIIRYCPTTGILA